jgi:hypothetical protein
VNEDARIGQRGTLAGLACHEEKRSVPMQSVCTGARI